MRSAVVLFSLVASATASLNLMAVPHVRRELNLIQPRQTSTPTGTASSGGGDDSCISAALGIADSMPTPPPALVSDLATNPQTDPCHFSVPQSLSSDFSSYSSEVMSWFESNESQILALASQCPEFSSYSDMVPVCTTAPGAAAGSSGSSHSSGAALATATATPSASGSGAAHASGTVSGSAATSTTKVSGASRENGVALVALAAAGLVAIAL